MDAIDEIPVDIKYISKGGPILETKVSNIT